MPIIIYPDLRLDYKVATHPSVTVMSASAEQVTSRWLAVARNRTSPGVASA
jgi:hypothetical protein